ncbi:hypothetical protein F4680DRAFT_453342 [Xylaria scruposa]|nr:hypothetical protein F4680DRAFT_453342 [Xylaria scruposa]
MILICNYQMATLLLSITLLFRDVSAADVTTFEADVPAADGNLTALRTQLALPWSTTSPVRRMANILWASVVTLSVCVYTVVHVNVPPPGEDKRILWRRRAFWVFAGTPAPDYALWTTYGQWDVVRRLRQEMQKLEARQEDKAGQRDEGEKKSGKQNHGKRQFGWTYVAIGGLTINITPIHSTIDYMAITPTGLVILAEHDRFIEVPKRTIDDKSKADALTKVIFCLQVAWLIIQSIGQAAKGLPIALLEIHVLAHVVLDMKPFNVYDAIRINSSGFEDDVALMLVISLADERQQKRWRDGYKTDHTTVQN